jgi:hypothetical protein
VYVNWRCVSALSRYFYDRELTACSGGVKDDCQLHVANPVEPLMFTGSADIGLQVSGQGQVSPPI